MCNRVHSFVICTASLVVFNTANGYTHRPARKVPNLAWTRDYAAPYASATANARAKVQRQVSEEPRLQAALHVAFPQRQWFWKDHGRFWSVPELVHTFLAVSLAPYPGAFARLDDNRYVSEEGCVPHACFDRGLLWLDTDPVSPAMIFVATDVVVSSDSGDTHAWVFVSNTRLGNTLPAAFQQSAKRWYDNQAAGYEQRIILATIVTPDGSMRDIGLTDMIGQKLQAGVTP